MTPNPTNKGQLSDGAAAAGCLGGAGGRGGLGGGADAAGADLAGSLLRGGDTSVLGP